MNDDGSARNLGRFLTVADTAALLNISVSSAYSLVRSGELAAIRIGTGGQWRVEQSAIDDFVAARYEEERRIRLWEQPAQELLDAPGWGERAGE